MLLLYLLLLADVSLVGYLKRRCYKPFPSVWYLCDYVIISTCIFICMCTCRRKERAKGCYLNDHYEQMFFDLLVIILVKCIYISDGYIRKAYIYIYVYV